ncbi:MAG TPA: hypothetical protein VK960_06920 [Acidimicrobiia bacterium]|nr:hypothetical protein [Acidimicrobiia bacterium]
MSAEHYRDLVDRVMDRHRWILCADAGAALTSVIKKMRERGAPRPLLLCGTRGTGELPTDEDCEMVVLETRGDTMMEGLRAYHAALRDLPTWAMDRIDLWDPQREARVLASFVDTDFEIDGRRSWGGRPESWIALEDKTTVQEIWRAAGVDHAPVEVVSADAANLTDAARRLGGSGGTVWAGDNREGWHGGAEYTRYVADPDDADEPIGFFSARCDEVRVMPFLEGVPASIHGMVFPGRVAAFRPIEMVVFRTPGSDRFRYASASSSWDPTDEVREEMRAAARRVGSHLRDLVDFKGAFTMDGVVTSDGWLPTELNPRFGAGLGIIARAADMPLLGISRLLAARETEGLDAAEIESISVEASDANRHLGGFSVVTQRIDETEERRAAWDGERVRFVEGDGGNAAMMRGPAAMGGMVRFTLDQEQIVPGTQAAPVVREAFRATDEEWGTGIGELIPGTLS